jgi:Homing endonuclease associated repeat
VAARGVNRYSEQDCIDALRRVAAKLDRTPLADNARSNGYEAHRDQGEPVTAVVIYRFGSWNAALDAAGLARNSRRRPDGFGGKTYADDELLGAVRAVIAEHGPYLTAVAYEVRRSPDQPSGSLIRRRLRKSVGTWTDIVAKAGGSCGSPRFPLEAAA